MVDDILLPLPIVEDIRFLLPMVDDIRFPLPILPSEGSLRPVVEPSRLDARELWISRTIGRRIGMHWTIIVPVISDEYLRGVSGCLRWEDGV